jgi:hypothetical protein
LLDHAFGAQGFEPRIDRVFRATGYRKAQGEIGLSKAALSSPTKLLAVSMINDAVFTNINITQMMIPTAAIWRMSDALSSLTSASTNGSKVLSISVIGDSFQSP